MGMTRVRKAARYSASPSGGLRPPDQAMFTLNPSPSSTPHCVRQHRHLMIERTKRLNKLKKKKKSRGNSTMFVYLVGISCSREEMAVVVPMDRYVKDARIVVKDLLRAVAMMNVLKMKKRNTVYKIESRTVISLWRNA